MKKRAQDSIRERAIRVGFAVALLTVPTIKAVNDCYIPRSHISEYATEPTQNYLEQQRENLNAEQREKARELNRTLYKINPGRFYSKA